MKRYWILLMILSINTPFANTYSSQIIYQYKNQYNVTEFTDRADSEKIFTQKFEIKKTSAEQQEAINRSLEKVRAYNKDFNQRYYDNKKHQYEAAKKNAEKKKKAKQKAEAEHNKKVSDLGWNRRRKHIRRDTIRKNSGQKGHSRYGLPR